MLREIRDEIASVRQIDVVHASAQAGLRHVIALALERTGGVDDQSRLRSGELSLEVRRSGIEPAQFDGRQIDARQIGCSQRRIAARGDYLDTGRDRKRTHDARAEVAISAEYQNTTAFLL
ncbi:hypothetical protein D9M71_751770 [compost metagenome]